MSISSGARGQPNLLEVSTKHIFYSAVHRGYFGGFSSCARVTSLACIVTFPASLSLSLTGCTTTCYHLLCMHHWLYIFHPVCCMALCFTVLCIVAYLSTVLAYSVLLCTRLLIHCNRLLCITVYLHNTFTDLRRGCLLSNIFFTLRVRKKYSTVQYSGINNRVPGNELRGKGGGDQSFRKVYFKDYEFLTSKFLL